MAATSSSVLSATDVSRDSFFLSRDKYLFVTEKIVNSYFRTFSNLLSKSKKCNVMKTVIFPKYVQMLKILVFAYSSTLNCIGNHFHFSYWKISARKINKLCWF